ncbi:hypothetical protein KM176_24490 [Pseudooceanicola sp. CBS1P-1]|uniref:DUF3168 domain-containing protein n=1 Tax=Pseudooceanicola albus TaxID=2692189 RepID=A0A6L7GC11_9RHOB|nr:MULTISPECIES: hypothetical protein [Pseudooceanicola]MBT9386981.1 hypothetical protein [Pseudooceanicola endophyticus]MBT9387022.1 hypothetical protein [Pseudooceanicola endophyticus]MXN21137.1 hypothetical protein [Pseudooceanicola albus]
MTHYRSTFRAQAKAALEASGALAGVTLLSAWAEQIDAATLPVMGVATPSERSSRSSHGGTLEKGTLLQVVLKRQGGSDLEDQLDTDTAAIEAAVSGALNGAGVQCLLEEVTTIVNGEGARRIGTATASFRVTSWHAA